MKQAIEAADLKDIFSAICEVLEAHKEELTALDAALGDGDLGMTVCNGFQEVGRVIGGTTTEDIGAILCDAGSRMNEVAPSTMGTLLSMAMIRMGMAASGRTCLETKDVVDVFEAGMTGMMAVGKAKPGDKTVLDSYDPALLRMRESLSVGEPLDVLLTGAVDGAREGVEKTKTMQSVHGRGSWYQEQSVGKQDPGATAGMYILMGIAQWCSDAKAS